MNKTKEVIVDFQKIPPGIVPSVVIGSEVDRVQYFKFLGINIFAELKWNFRDEFLRRLKTFHVSQRLSLKFHEAVIENVLTHGNVVTHLFKICAWLDSNVRILKTLNLQSKH